MFFLVYITNKPKQDKVYLMGQIQINTENFGRKE